MMIQELSKFEPVCRRYGPLKIKDGWKKDETSDEKSYIQIMDEILFTSMNPTSSKIMDEKKTKNKIKMLAGLDWCQTCALGLEISK